MLVYPYNGMLLSNNHKLLTQATTVMNLKIIMLSEKKPENRVYTVESHLYIYINLGKMQTSVFSLTKSKSTFLIA